MPILQHVMFNACNNKNFWTEGRKSQKKEVSDTEAFLQENWII